MKRSDLCYSLEIFFTYFVACFSFYKIFAKLSCDSLKLLMVGAGYTAAANELCLVWLALLA